MILQITISASQGRVKMEAFAIIPQLDTHAAARMITLGTTAIVSILLLLCTFKNICFHNLLDILNLVWSKGIFLAETRQTYNTK